jgi:Ca-activated chloride channel family protein
LTYQITGSQDMTFIANPHRAYPSRAQTHLIAMLAASLLLVTLAQAAHANVAERAPLRVNDVARGTLLVDGISDGAPRPAVLLDTVVAMDIDGMVARVSVRQTFTHDGDDWVNAVYVFPLPENAAVDHLRMHVGEHVLEGQIRPRAAARKAFEAARTAGKKATLIEQLRPNLFTSSVANIGPGETVRVEIEYQQTLAYADGWFSLRLPLTAPVRYVPGTPVTTGFDAGGWSYNTDQVADASAVTAPVTQTGVGHDNPVSISINLNAGMPFADILSSYHQIKRHDTGAGRHHIELLEANVAADRDFELRYQVAGGNAPSAAFFRQEVDGESYGLMMLVPPRAQVGEKIAAPREVIFVVDTSGSMHGVSLSQARAALGFALNRLHRDDTFNIVQFNSTVQAFSPTALEASARHLAQARRYIGQLHADGGTEMAAALNAVLDGRERHARLRQVVFITDGSVANEAALFSIIDDRLGASRLFTVGIGSAPNSHFMSEAAHVGRGTYTYIGDVAEVQTKMSGLLEKLEFPVLAGIHIDGGNDTLETWPQPLADLYLREPLLVSLRLGAQQELTLKGMLGQQAWSTRVPVTGGGSASGLDVIWARQKIASLSRSLARGANHEEVREQITALGLKHHLVTAHTSLVAIDVTPSRRVDAASRNLQVPSKMPDSWTMSAPTPRLPQTATGLAQYQLLALLLGLCGVWTRARGARRAA